MEERRRILLVVTGLSPQVVTETLYALAVARSERWVPHEIRAITTRQGAESLRAALLGDNPGWFHRLCRDYRLPPIRFDDDCIEVVTDNAGKPLSDIRTPADNERAADVICERVRELTADPSTVLHVSIAGGRKTMGYYLGYALSLFGRPGDSLSHVLVSEPFESCRDFFYPTPEPAVIHTRNGATADAREARVTLAEIPFVSLRHGLDDGLLEGSSRFSEVVAAAHRSLTPPELYIDPVARTVLAGGRRFRLPPTQLALLTLFARRVLLGQPSLPAPPKDCPDLEWRRRFLEEYDAILSNEMDDRDRTHGALAKGMDGSYFSSLKSSLHRSLKRKLGASAAGPYLIDDGGTLPRRYSLRLPATAIRIEGHKPASHDGPARPGQTATRKPSSAEEPNP